MAAPPPRGGRRSPHHPMAHRGQGRGSTRGAPADDPPARPSGPSFPARRHPSPHVFTWVTTAESRHQPGRRSRCRRQFEALHGRHKTITHIELAQAGLDVSGETVAYIAVWGESGSLEAIPPRADDRRCRAPDRAGGAARPAIMSDVNQKPAQVRLSGDITGGYVVPSSGGAAGNS